MKQFFKFFFAALLANWLFWMLSVFFSTIIFLGFVFGLASWSGKKASELIQESTMLVLSLDQAYGEVKSDLNPLSVISSFSSDNNGWKDESLTSIEVQMLLKKAASDDRVKGILIKGSMSIQDRVVANSLRDALQQFKSSGKPIYAYSENYLESNYYIASVADSVFMHPEGVFEWNGLSVRLTFYKKLMEKMGVNMQIFYAGDYKSATEPYRNEKMSPYNREQLQSTINILYAQMLASVSASRNIDIKQLKNFANNLSIVRNKQALQKGLIDATMIYSDAIKRINIAVNSQDKDDVDYLSLGSYAQGYSTKELINQDFDLSSSNEIALLYMQGEMGVSKEGNMITSEFFSEKIKMLAEDDDIKAVVVRVISPGGSALIAETLWQELRNLKQKKPLVVSMGGVAASGGYYLACTGDSVFASPKTITGSIGVFAMIPNIQQLITDKLYLTYDEVNTSPHASTDFFTKKLDGVQKKRIQEMVDDIYGVFLDRVSRSRSMDKTDVHKVAQGRIWVGAQAKEKGLVDDIGDEWRAVKSAAVLADISSYKVVLYPKDDNWFMQKLSMFVSKVYDVTGVLELLNHPMMKLVYDAKNMEQKAGIPQARLPFDME